MFGPTPGSKQKIGQSFPRGTTMLFWQASAPVGWTKVTTQNDKLLRIVNGVGGAAGGGGSNPFSTVNAQTAVGNTTLSTAQMPSHAHSYVAPISPMAFLGCACNQNGTDPGNTTGSSTGAAGGGGAHNHTITTSIQFIDLIMASKN
jgi:hypothetical protein